MADRAWPGTSELAGSGAERVKQLLGMEGGIDLLEDALDLPVRADEEGGADDPHELFAAGALFQLPDAELLGDLVVGVGEESKR